jgi:hypothetical protein
VKVLSELANGNGPVEAKLVCVAGPAETAYPDKDKPKAATAAIINLFMDIQSTPLKDTFLGQELIDGVAPYCRVAAVPQRSNGRASMLTQDDGSEFQRNSINVSIDVNLIFMVPRPR